MTDIKRLPSMRMEKEGHGYSDRENRLRVRNALRQQILSELTSKPTLNKGKIGKDRHQLLEELKQK